MEYKELSIWLILGIFWVSFSGGPDKAYIKSIKKHRKERKKEFKDPHRSPLREEAKSFKKLDYFPISTDYRIEASFERTSEAIPFKIPTSDPNTFKEYVSYGRLSFQQEGEVHELTVFRSLRLSRLPMYKDYLFLPFRDMSSGGETYGGGRYLDLQVSNEEKWIIDFNLAYNPNCAYSEGWACPIPPSENNLSIPIRAGEKNYPH